MHEKFASLNNLNIGDKVKLDQNGKMIELEIVGIFSGEKTNTFEGLSSDFIENTIYTDYATSQELLNTTKNNKVTMVEYGVDNPTELDNIIKNIEDLQINNITISKSNKNYDSIISFVESITKLTNIIRKGSVVVGVVILSLVLMFWVRERLYEIGVLLSLGISKMNLILQFIVEALMVSIFGVLLALGLESLIMKYVSTNPTSLFSDDLPGIISEELMKVTVRGMDIINVVVVMISIVIISVIVALLPILKMEPKKILTKIS